MKTYSFYSGSIKYNGLKLFVFVAFLFFSFLSKPKAQELNVDHLLVIQNSNFDYTFQGFFVNRTFIDYNSAATLSTQIKDQIIESYFPNIYLKQGDSVLFTVRLTLDQSNPNANAKSKKWLSYSELVWGTSIMCTTDDTNKNDWFGSQGNNKYETVYACIWVESYVNNKKCIFTVSEEEYKLAGRKGRTVVKKPDTEFDDFEDLSFKVYPNPIVNITFILVNSCKNRPINVQVIDNLGQEVKQFEAFIPEGSEFIEVDMNEFGPGVYFFKVKSNDEVVVTSVIKTN